MHLHDTDLFDEINDDDVRHLTKFNTMPTSKQMSSYDLTSTINVLTLSNQSTTPSNQLNSYTFQQLDNTIQECYLHKLCFNIDEPQIDSGANKSVTNDQTILQYFKQITPIPVYGVGTEDVACHLTGYGQLTLHTDSKITLQIKVYYSPTCSGTIISPNAVVRDSPAFTSWAQTSHLDIGTASVQFFNRQNPHSRISITLHMHNSLWFSRQPYTQMRTKAKPHEVCYLDSVQDDTIIINKMQKHVEYELWHQRLMHVGQTCMNNIHKCTQGVPILHRHDLHNCHICNEMNVTKSSSNVESGTTISLFGQRFQMDYGFMRGANDTRNNIRSHEGYNCYLLIVDYYTRYTWVFLSKNKNPPLKLLTTFLQTYGNKDGILKRVSFIL